MFIQPPQACLLAAAVSFACLIQGLSFNVENAFMCRSTLCALAYASAWMKQFLYEESHFLKT